jgi:hypothetical protein
VDPGAEAQLRWTGPDGMAAEAPAQVRALPLLD